jgi:hypothetical protein
MKKLMKYSWFREYAEMAYDMPLAAAFIAVCAMFGTVIAGGVLTLLLTHAPGFTALVLLAAGGLWKLIRVLGKLHQEERRR